MDASNPSEPHSNEPGAAHARPLAELGLISGAAAPLWAAILFAERMRARQDARIDRGLMAGVADGALGRLGAAAFAQSAVLAKAGIALEPMIDAEIAASVHAGAQSAARQAGERLFSVYYSSASALSRGGASALQRLVAGGATGGGLIVIAEDPDAAPGMALATAQGLGAPTLHPSTPVEAVDACVFALEEATNAGAWRVVVLGIEAAESAEHQHEDAAEVSEALWRGAPMRMGAADAARGLIAIGGGAAILERSLEMLGVDDDRSAELGLAVIRIGRSAPIEGDALVSACAGLGALWVVEPAPGVANAMRDAFYGRAEAPKIEAISAEDAPLAAEALAVALARRIAQLDDIDKDAKLAIAKRAEALKAGVAAVRAGGRRIAPGRTDAMRAVAEWIGAARFGEAGRRTIRLDSIALETGAMAAIRAAARAETPTTFQIRWRPAPLWAERPETEGDALAPAPKDPTAPSRLSARLLAAGVDALGVLTHPARPIDRRRLPSMVSVETHGDRAKLEAELERSNGVVAILDLTDYDGPEAVKRFGVGPDATVVAINRNVCGVAGGCDLEAGAAMVREVGEGAEIRTGRDVGSAGVEAAHAPGGCPCFIGAASARLRALSVPKATGLPDPKRDPARRLAVIGFAGEGAAQSARILSTAARREGRAVGLWVAAEGAPSLGVAALCRIGAEESEGRPLAGPPALGELDAVISCGRATPPVAEFFRSPAAARAAVKTATEEATPRALGAAYFGSDAHASIIALGAAYQRGILPIGGEAMGDALASECAATRTRAETAFDLGRATAAPGSTVAAALTARAPEPTLEELIERRTEALVAYQSESWAERYRDGVASAARSEKIVAPESEVFAKAAAEGLYALMSYCDFYELARRVAETTKTAANEAFEPLEGERLKPIIFWPSALFAGRDEVGAPRKIALGSWALPILHVLKRGRIFRGGLLDPAGWGALRRLERELIDQYERDLVALGRGLSPERLPIAVEIARLPLEIRGFGPVKERAAAAAAARRAELWATFRGTRALGGGQQAE